MVQPLIHLQYIDRASGTSFWGAWWVWRLPHTPGPCAQGTTVQLQKALGQKALLLALLLPHHPVLRGVLSPTPLLSCMLPVLLSVSILIFFFNISLLGHSEAVRKEAANYY